MQYGVLYNVEYYTMQSAAQCRVLYDVEGYAIWSAQYRIINNAECYTMQSATQGYAM